jgi:uncharacterized protein (TIRG00374 family)
MSLALLALVVWLANPAQILPALLGADLRWVAAGAGVWVAVQLMNVWKWWLLAQAQGLSVRYRQLLDVYFIGMFFNTFLPSGFGGDLMRVYEVSKLSPQGGGGSTASVAADRFTSLYALCLVAAAAQAVAPPDLRAVPTWALALLVVGGGAAFALLLQASWLASLAGHRLLAGRPRVSRFLESLADGLGALREASTTLGVALAISIAFQALSVVLHYCLIRALNLDVTLAYTALFFPILALAASLPITVNGLAVREGGFAYFLGKVGVAPAQAVAVGLLSFAMLLASAAWGAAVYAGLKPKKPIA